MKRLAHKPELLFATNFSWWFRSSGTERAAGFSRAFNSSRSPAEAGSRNKVVARLPPTEVGGKQDSCDATTTAQQENLDHARPRARRHMHEREVSANNKQPGNITRPEACLVSITQSAIDAAGLPRRVRSHKLLDDNAIHRLGRLSASGPRPTARRLLKVFRSGHEGGSVGQAIEGAA